MYKGQLTVNLHHHEEEEEEEEEEDFAQTAMSVVQVQSEFLSAFRSLSALGKSAVTENP